MLDLTRPNRWHLFWIALITRRDAMPDAADVNTKAMDVLYAYARVCVQHRFGLHAGVVGVLGDECREGVMEGWRRLFGVARHEA